MVLVVFQAGFLQLWKVTGSCDTKESLAGCSSHPPAWESFCAPLFCVKPGTDSGTNEPQTMQIQKEVVRVCNWGP